MPKSTKTVTRVVEQELGIPADYQYRAIRSKNWLQANWHANKWTSVASLLRPEMSVLDLGTGSGNFELQFWGKVKHITGLDYNSQALTFLKKRLKERNIRNVSLIEADLRNIGKIAWKRKYDLIILVDVLEHIRVEEAHTVVRTLYKLLKPKGSICVITPNYRSSWLILETVLDRFHAVPKLDGEQHLAKYSSPSLTELFVRSGGRSVNISSFNLFSFLIPQASVSAMAALWELRTKIAAGNLLWGQFEAVQRVTARRKHTIGASRK